MTIKEAEALSGVSKRNIRFYEQKGLLSPGRNRENDYRSYLDEDIVRLRLIRVLRMVDMPLEQIKGVVNGRQTLAEAVEAHRGTLIVRKNQTDAAIMLCDELCNAGDVEAVLKRIDSEDQDKYLFRQWWQDYLENVKHNIMLLLIGLVPSFVGYCFMYTKLRVLLILPGAAHVISCLYLLAWGYVGYLLTKHWGHPWKNTLLTHAILCVFSVLFVVVEMFTSYYYENVKELALAAFDIAYIPLLFMLGPLFGEANHYYDSLIEVSENVSILIQAGVLMLVFLAGGVIAKLRIYFSEKKRKQQI